MNEPALETRESEVIHRTREHVRSMFSQDSSGHDFWHIERVRVMALRLAREESANPFVVQLGALLHDIADWKFHDGDLTVGPRLARSWMTEQSVAEEVIDLVVEIVETISFKGAGVPTPMRTIEGKVVQDADRLDAMGAIGIARTFAYGGHKKHPIHDPERDPTPHATFEDYKNDAGPTTHHFHEKLLLLRDRMNTEAAKRIADARHRYMEEFLDRFHHEWEGRA